MKRSLLVIVATLLAISCGAPDETIDASSGDTTMTTISGNLIYRERIALIPGGAATVTLSDVSLQDVPAPVIAETIVDLDGQQVPISFEISFDDFAADPQASYAIRATITGPAGNLEWTTDTAHLIGLGQPIIEVGDLLLVRATSPEPDAGQASSIVADWKMTEINGAPAISGSSANLRFDADGTLGGNTSCNSYATSYTATETALAVNPAIAVTMMACDGPTSAQEQAFLDVLNAIAADGGSFEVDEPGSTLTLTSSDGAVIKATR